MLDWLKPKLKAEKPKTLGQRGEEFAQGVYRSRGYEVIAANVYNKKGLRKGEVDFIAKNKTQLIFVEVKTRILAVGKFGSAEDAVNYFKQQKLLKAAKIYLLQNPQYQHLQPMIDVCVIEFRPIDNSFECGNFLTIAVEDYN